MIQNHGTQVHSLLSLLKAEMKLIAVQSSVAGGDRRTLKKILCVRKIM